MRQEHINDCCKLDVMPCRKCHKGTQMPFELPKYREYWLLYYDVEEDQIRLASWQTALADLGFRHTTAEQRLARDEAVLRAALAADAWLTVIEDERTALEVKRQRPG